MKIEEARQTYNIQIKSNQEQKKLLDSQKKELEKKIKSTPDGQTVYANEAAVLELSLHALEEKQSEYQTYMEKLLEQWSGQVNLLAAKQQGEAMEEYVEDIGKIMEVARRLMKGAIVPPSDERKLMEYSNELYQAAKNIGALAKLEKREKYDSLWEEKQEEECGDPVETANNTEAFADGPEIVEAADLLAENQVP